MTAVMLRFDELQSAFGELMREQFARSYCVMEDRYESVTIAGPRICATRIVCAARLM